MQSSNQYRGGAGGSSGGRGGRGWRPKAPGYNPYTSSANPETMIITTNAKNWHFELSLNLALYKNIVELFQIPPEALNNSFPDSIIVGLLKSSTEEETDYNIL